MLSIQNLISTGFYSCFSSQIEKSQEEPEVEMSELFSSTISELKADLSQKNTTISIQSRKINRLQSQLKEKSTLEATSKEFEEKLKKKDKEILKIKEELSEKDKEINHLKRTPAEKDKEIMELKNKLKQIAKEAEEKERDQTEAVKEYIKLTRQIQEENESLKQKLSKGESA